MLGSASLAYHSEVKPSGPGHLFAFNLEIAEFNSSLVISDVNPLFCSSQREGKSREAKNESVWEELSICG